MTYVDPILTHEAILWDTDTPASYLSRVLSQCPADMLEYVQGAGDVYLAHPPRDEDPYASMVRVCDMRCLPQDMVPFMVAYVLLEQISE